MLRIVLGGLLVVAGIVAAVYVGIVWALVGGIIAAIHAFSAHPANVSSGVWDSLRALFFESFAGLTFLIVGGVGMAIGGWGASARSRLSSSRARLRLGR